MRQRKHDERTTSARVSDKTDALLAFNAFSRCRIVPVSPSQEYEVGPFFQIGPMSLR